WTARGPQPRLLPSRISTNMAVARRRGWKPAVVRYRLDLVGYVDDGFRKGLGRFLGQVVPDAAGDQPMRILAGELAAVVGRFGMRRAVGVALERNGRHRDRRTDGKPLFQVVILPLTVGQSLPPAIIVDGNRNVIRVRERHGTAIERGVVEV